MSQCAKLQNHMLEVIRGEQRVNSKGCTQLAPQWSSEFTSQAQQGFVNSYPNNACTYGVLIELVKGMRALIANVALTNSYLVTLALVLARRNKGCELKYLCLF